MAYNAATVVVNQSLPDGGAHLQIRFTGNAGEPAVLREHNVNAGATALSLRQWAIAQADGLNSVRTLATTAQLQPGQTFNLTPITPPAPTAEQVWLDKAARLQRAAGLGLTNATAVSDIATLRTDVNVTYLSAYLGRL